MKFKNVVAGFCVSLSINFFMPKHANAIEPITVLFWMGVGGWLNNEVNKDKPVPKIEPDPESTNKRVEYDSDSIQYISFDDELLKKVGKSQIISVSKGVVQDYGTSVSNSFEVSFDENERNNIGGSIGFAKIERAITKNYSKSYGQQVTTSQKVALDGNSCQEYLVQEIVNYRQGKIAIEHNNSEIDFEIVDSVQLKASDLCDL